jgi:hypothetical protein
VNASSGAGNQGWITANHPPALKPVREVVGDHHRRAGNDLDSFSSSNEFAALTQIGYLVEAPNFRWFRRIASAWKHHLFDE